MEVLTGAPVLVVAFGGIKHGIGIDVPPFEFLRSLSAPGCDAVFLRDVSQAWYQHGIDGVSTDVMGLAHWLEARRRGYRRTVVVGNSMGGYAALLFGWLAGFDLIVAVSPQTTIALPDLSALADRRWQALLERGGLRSTDPRHHDVRNVMSRSVPAAQASLLFFGASSREDRAHAMRLAAEPGCHLFAVRDSQHQAARMLRDTGILARLFGMICDPAIRLQAMLDDLRADDRLTAVGGQPPASAAEGRGLEPLPGAMPAGRRLE
jgi:pimeloyl-ACP methyl ester carboxylesterase